MSIVRFICPFCGREVQAGDFEDMGAQNGPRGERTGVVHVLPMCETFERLDPLDFLALAREKIRVTKTGKA